MLNSQHPVSIGLACKTLASGVCVQNSARVTISSTFPLSRRLRNNTFGMQISYIPTKFGRKTRIRQVFWDGREIGTTAVCRKTLSPVWFVGGGGGKKTKTLAGSPVASQEEKPYFWLESTRSANPRLRVELYDWNAVSTHDFLGGIELDMAELVELQRATLGKARANGGNTDQQVCKA